jgi:hypothetical protein
MEAKTTYEFNGVLFELGEDVGYSVYPAVEEGTGIIVDGGIRSTGETLVKVTAQGLGDFCPWEDVYVVWKKPA